MGEMAGLNGDAFFDPANTERGHKVGLIDLVRTVC